jgi:membrane-associated phospholipid phosphatase
MPDNGQDQYQTRKPRWTLPGRNLIASGWIRRNRARLFQIYALLAVIAFAALATLAELNQFLPFELSLTQALQSQTPGWVGVLLRWVNWPGFAPQNFILVGISLIILSLLGLRWEGVSALFAALGTGTLNYLIKIAIRRPRPTEDLVEVLEILDSYSFPSGHVMFYTTFFGFLLFLAFILLNKSGRRTLALMMLAMLITLVGLARMYVGDHWITDVVAGYLAGSLMLALSILFYRWGKPRFFVDQPTAPPVEDKSI